MRQIQLIITIAACLLATSQVSAEQQPANPVKLTSAITTLDGHEGIIADVSIEPGAAMPVHQHPGDEFLYMLSGSVELAQENQPPLILSAGDAHKIAAGTIHSPKAGPEGARAIVFRVHPSGEPVTVIINE